MEEYISLLKNTDLFKGVEEAAIGPLLPYRRHKLLWMWLSLKKAIFFF